MFLQWKCEAEERKYSNWRKPLSSFSQISSQFASILSKERRENVLFVRDPLCCVMSVMFLGDTEPIYYKELVYLISGVLISIVSDLETQENWCYSSRLKASRPETQCGYMFQFKFAGGSRQEEFPRPTRRLSLFVLIQPSTDQMRASTPGRIICPTRLYQFMYSTHPITPSQTHIEEHLTQRLSALKLNMWQLN